MHALAALALLIFAGADPARGAGRANGDEPAAGVPAPEEALRAELVALARERMAEHEVPGLALLLIRGGEEAWFEGLGFADVETATPITRDTVFNVGSVSKCIAAFGAMRLVERGAIELDEPVVPRLERWRPPRSRYDANGITVRRLLSHTAGLSVSGIDAYDAGDELPSIEDELARRTKSSDRVRLVGEPGARFAYSGGGYMALQLLIEELTGRGFGEVLRGEVLRPLGMASSDYGWTDAARAAAATPYNRRGRAMEERRFAGVAAAGLQTTPADLARFARACLPEHRGEAAERVLSRAALELMQRTAPPAERWGLGFQTNEWAGYRVVGHTGGTLGWISGMWVVPETGDGIVMLSNGTNADRFADELDAAWVRFLERTRPDARAPREARYRLRVDAAEPRALQVEADVPLGGRTLQLGGGHALPEGQAWSHWLRDLAITSPAGEPLEWRASGPDRCFLRGELPESAHLSYRVLVEHDALEWPAGLGEAAYAREDGFFLRAYAALIAPGKAENVDAVRVAFELPEGWRVSTSLTPVVGRANEYLAPSARAGYEAGLRLGRQEVTERIVRGVRLELAVGSDLSGASEVMASTLENAVRGAVDLFGDAPAGRFTVIAARAADPASNGGSGFPGGMAVMLGRNPADDPRGGWAHTLTHELLHMWNGVAIASRAGPATDFFTEGFTDYLALVVEGRRGTVADGWRLAYLAGAWDAYSLQAGTRSLSAAGFEKLQHEGLVYGGGQLFALLLDLRLRRAGRGLGLDDLMRAMYAEFGATGETFTLDDVERVAVALGGDELAELFDRHVRGRHAIELGELLAPLGLLRTEAQVGSATRSRFVRDPGASTAARRLRYAVLGIE